MEDITPRLSGLHHVTAITSDAQRNVDFYTGLLGLRLVKVTVNFDEPVEHLGSQPKLPPRLEPARAEIEQVLPPLHLPGDPQDLNRPSR